MGTAASCFALGIRERWDEPGFLSASRDEFYYSRRTVTCSLVSTIRTADFSTEAVVATGFRLSFGVEALFGDGLCVVCAAVFGDDIVAEKIEISCVTAFCA